MPRAGLDPDRVVRAAADLVDDVGHDQLTLAAVAAHFDVAVPSLYKHVGGIDDLHGRLAVLAVEELGARLAAAAGGPHAGDEPFRTLARAYRAYAVEHPGRYAATVRAPGPDDVALRAASDAVLSTVLAVLGDLGLTGDDAVDAARAVRSALHGFVTLEAAGGFGLPRDVDRSFTSLVDTLHRGLLA
ncbi:TetR/AcrR family transcriptional regulator [Salsipaludibacter albus]|uniref:TetR/AcrR family transcriptional regulator n=1 Tax=Salsipaludibacter albus TaxID=2849650 RepID=UPI001EE4536E|nr:WHG domain-containing protein [Salsipaludibacter albus]